MFQKMIEKYKQYGLTGLFLSGMGYEFKQTAKLFSSLAELASTKVPLSSIEKELLVRNHIFKNKHKGHRCFVVGNGPSLNKQDLSLLSSEITIVVNAFWKNNIVEKWQPNYYCFADPKLFDGSEEVNRFFCDLRSRIHSSKFLVPVYAQKIIAEQNSLPLEKTYYTTFRGKLSKIFKYEIDLSKSMPGPRNVIQLGIMWALYMGCTPIYLIGVDHDWLACGGKFKHFYKDKTIKNFTEEYRDSDRISYKDILHGIHFLWDGYENLLKIASRKNIDIINVSNNSSLDVFERANYESIFSMKNIK